MGSGGNALKRLRLKLGFTLSDVAAASKQVAESKGNENYAVNISRLSEIESKGLVPSIFRFYSLALIYRVELPSLLRMYDVEITPSLENSITFAKPPNTHLSELTISWTPPPTGELEFQAEYTQILSNVSKNIPLAVLSWFTNAAFRYGYIGAADLTMDPLLPPGSFVQIDESRTQIASGFHQSEFTRPVYFVETRDGYTCCWCNLTKNQLTLIPHQLSPVLPRRLQYPQEAEVLGQVIAVAINRFRESRLREKTSITM